MKRSVWKWILGTSVASLVFILVYLVVFWALANAMTALTTAMMEYAEETVNYDFISFLKFYKSFIGEPVFYISLVPAISLIISIIMLIVNKKKKS